MALVTLEFESQYLGNNHTVGVILPDKPRNLTPQEFYGSGKKYKKCCGAGLPDIESDDKE